MGNCSPLWLLLFICRAYVVVGDTIQQLMSLINTTSPYYPSSSWNGRWIEYSWPPLKFQQHPRSSSRVRQGYDHFRSVLFLLYFWCTRTWQDSIGNQFHVAHSRGVKHAYVLNVKMWSWNVLEGTMHFRSPAEWTSQCYIVDCISHRHTHTAPKRRSEPRFGMTRSKIDYTRLFQSWKLSFWDGDSFAGSLRTPPTTHVVVP